MVVRNAQRLEPRPVRTRAIVSVAAVIERGLAPFDTSHRSIRKARAASVALSSAVPDRHQVAAFLADYASVRSASGQRAPQAS